MRQGSKALCPLSTAQVEAPNGADDYDEGVRLGSARRSVLLWRSPLLQTTHRSTLLQPHTLLQRSATSTEEARSDEAPHSSDLLF